MPKKSEAEIYAALCDFFSRQVVFPGKFEPADDMTHTSAASRDLANKLQSHLATGGLDIVEKHEPIDIIFWEVMTDLQEWGAVKEWRRDWLGNQQVMYYTIGADEFTIYEHEIEDHVGALVNGWISARSHLNPQDLAPGELSRIEVMGLHDTNEEK